MGSYVSLKRSGLRHFKRYRASKLFTCFQCQGPIEKGIHYWRLISKYKYCDDCFLKLLLTNGFYLAVGKTSECFRISYASYIDKKYLSLDRHRKILATFKQC